MERIDLSIVIPYFNDSEHIESCVKSIVDQTGNLPTYEIIIINDKSTAQGSFSKLVEVKNRYSENCRIIIIQNLWKRGAGAARNTGISAASAEWIAFLDADDIYTPGSLEARWEIVRTAPEAKWISSDYIGMTHCGKVDQLSFGTQWLTSLPEANNAISTKSKYAVLQKPVEKINYGVVFLITVMVKKSLLIQVDGFNENLKINQDFNLWVRLAASTDLHYSPYIGSQYRRHDNNTTKSAATLPPHYWKLKSINNLIECEDLENHRTYLRGLKVYYLKKRAYKNRKNRKYFAGLISSFELVTQQPVSYSNWKSFVAASLGM